MDNKHLNSSGDQKKSLDFFSIAIVIVAVVALFYLTDLKEGFDSALLICTITIAFPLSFRIPAIILKGLKNGMEKIKIELILLSLLLLAGLIIIGSYTEDWRLILLFPTVSLLWTAVTLTGRFIRRKPGF